MSEAGPKADEPQQDEVLQEFPAELDEAGLEQFLQQEAREFSDALQEIQNDKSLEAREIALSDEEQELADEINKWEASKGLPRILVRVLPFLPRLKIKIRKLHFQLMAWMRGLWVRFKNFCYFLATDGRHQIVAALKNSIAAAAAVFKSAGKRFSTYSKVMKFFAICILFFAGGTCFFIYRSLTKGVFPETQKLFIASMADVADEAFEYEPGAEMEYFYDNLRTTQNLLLLPRVVVNIKPSASSGVNPMAAFEFFIEGLIPEVIVEVKDREAAIKDLVQRTIEDFTFDVLDTPEGKRELCEKLVKEINRFLTTGTIQKVLIKTVVIKP